MATKTPTVPTELRKALTDPTPLYAVAGVGDFAVEKLRHVPARLAELRSKAPEPKDVADDVQARVRALQSEAQELPIRATSVALVLAGRAGEMYDDFAARGKNLVGRIQRQRATEDLKEQASTTVRRTKAAGTTARKSAARTKQAAKGAATSAVKTAEAAGKAVEDGADKVG